MCRGLRTYLRDLLNVPHGLETQLDLTKGGHVTSLGGRSPQHGRLGSNTSERTPSKHDGEEKGERAVVVVVGAVDVDFGKWRVQVRSAPKLPVLQFGAELELITGVITDQVL